MGDLFHLFFSHTSFFLADSWNFWCMAWSHWWIVQCAIVCLNQKMICSSTSKLHTFSSIKIMQCYKQSQVNQVFPGPFSEFLESCNGCNQSDLTQEHLILTTFTQMFFMGTQQLKRTLRTPYLVPPYNTHFLSYLTGHLSCTQAVIPRHRWKISTIHMMRLDQSPKNEHFCHFHIMTISPTCPLLKPWLGHENSLPRPLIQRV
jgi:hypothetical protein